MNESETRAEYVDPKLKNSGWENFDEVKVLREYPITQGRIQVGGARTKPEIADYVLVYKNQKLAVIEAKRNELEASEGVMQAKTYADKLQTPYTYATNGKQIYEISMKDGKEQFIDHFPTPSELWQKVNFEANEWKSKFDQIPFEDIGGTKTLRYYQELAVDHTLSAISNGKNRILLTLATGTGKTFIAFQIAWKLFHARWNLSKDGTRRPRILFLADRNILANQAFNSFSQFPADALVRIKPMDIRKKGAVPTNGSVFFTIFQTFMSGQNDSPYFGDYPADFFDFIIIDECHRGGANDESNWRSILEYFSPAVQLGLTATPKRKDNVDTYKYFGDPVYVYSLKTGINDGFLTPFKVRRIQTTLDEYIYTRDDQIIEGEIEEGKIYQEEDFNRIIEIKERESKRVDIVLEEINQDEKTIIFCANQEHAAAIRDLINQKAKSKNPHYCVRVTANDGARGEQFLKDFQDNEKSIPTILTTSQKLSTGVDARNIRNIVLMRPVSSMIEFKQIVGRGTRIFDGKEYFTIYDFVNAYKHFNDPKWDGEPIDENTSKIEKTTNPEVEQKELDKHDAEEEKTSRKKIVIKLRDGKEREIQYMTSTSFWSANGKPISTEEFLQNLYGKLPDFFKNEKELRKIWSNPITRRAFLEKLSEAGYDKENLENLQKMINAQNSDIFDVLAYISFSINPISRNERVKISKTNIFSGLNDNEIEFIEFVLSKYVKDGVDVLDEEKLPVLLNIKYHALADAQERLGRSEKIRTMFFHLQKILFSESTH